MAMRTAREFLHRLALVVIFILMLVLLTLNTHTFGFSNNQYAVIAIGQWKSPSYGILSPDGGLTFDPFGNLWVADTFNNRVLVFTPPFGANMSASYVLGQSSLHGTTYGIGPASIGRPVGIVADSKGSIWVVDPDNARILDFEPPFHNGMNASMVIGQPDFESNTPHLTRSGLYPEWATFDTAGDLWVSDGGNSRVLEFRPPFSTGMNASIVIGQPDFTHNYCPVKSQGCESWTVLHSPGDLAFDPAGDLWVIEYGVNPERLVEFKPPFSNGMSASNVFSGELPAFNVLAFDSAGNLWMGSSQGVFEFKTPFSNPYTQPVNASASLGGYPGESWSKNLLTPSGLTFDSSGNLWVTDCVSCWLMPDWNGRVLGFDARAHPVYTVFGTVLFVNSAGLLQPLRAVQLTQMNSIPFPEGLFNFTIQGLQPGGSVELTISFPRPVNSELKWLSYSDGHWSELPSNETSISGSNVTLTLNNATQAGVISMLGGLSLLPPYLTSTLTSAAASTLTSTPLSAQRQQIPSALVLAVSMILAVTVAVTVAIRKGRRHI